VAKLAMMRRKFHLRAAVSLAEATIDTVTFAGHVVVCCGSWEGLADLFGPLRR
jgi:hypothetical protein